MTLPAGTVGDFTGSLAEQIEAAFAGELYAVKQARLPDAGKAERRILFCAIAQATLAFLAANPGGLELELTFTSGLATGGTVAVQAPTLTAVDGFGAPGVSGTGWPGSPVTVTAVTTGAVQTVLPDAGGSISVTFADGTTGVIDGRDGDGNAAQAVIE
jgi:hypothetical protein